ncbi:LIC13341 family surface-exposed protein [Leptospira kirschneri]|uniref:LIC13341 family surface-exposed protein n=1 Tax=Leptospira kirschneri TaxID=29507 RepID=UPI00356201EA
MNPLLFLLREIFPDSFVVGFKVQISRLKLDRFHTTFLARFLIFVLIQTLFVVCSSKTPSDSKIIELLFSANEKKNPDVLLKKAGNLDEDPELESFSLVRNGTEEVLGIFKKQKGEWHLLGKFSFSLLNIGPLHYDVSKSSWLPGEPDSQKKEAGFIVKRILMDELPGDGFNSLFLEVLSEEPPLGLFSVPYVIRKDHKILDGLMALKDHEFLIKSKRIDFEYNKTEKNITIFPSNRNYAQNFIFNGWEMVPDIARVAVPSLLSLEAPKEWKKGVPGEVVIWFKNRGSYSAVTYLSISFPDGGKINIDTTKEGQRMYSPGSSVFSSSGKYISSTVPLVEITKEGWGRNHKYGIRFTLTPDKDGIPNVLFRSSTRMGREVVNLPNQFGSIQKQTDQQGFVSYKLGLVSKQE